MQAEGMHEPEVVEEPGIEYGQLAVFRAWEKGEAFTYHGPQIQDETLKCLYAAWERYVEAQA